ncbi:hypothetical protein PAMP_012207 [Pampus punctatissimus]
MLSSDSSVFKVIVFQVSDTKEEQTGAFSLQQGAVTQGQRSQLLLNLKAAEEEEEEEGGGGRGRRAFREIRPRSACCRQFCQKRIIMADDFDVEAMLEAPYRKGKMCDRGGIELLQSKNENG